MKSSYKQTNRLIITYPQKPGFTLLAYQIFVEIKEQFDLSGVYEEDKDGQFTVILDGIQIYISKNRDISSIDRQKIIDAVSEIEQPVTVNKKTDCKRSESSEADNEEYPDCFCSGE